MIGKYGKPVKYRFTGPRQYFCQYTVDRAMLPELAKIGITGFYVTFFNGKAQQIVVIGPVSLSDTEAIGISLIDEKADREKIVNRRTYHGKSLFDYKGYTVMVGPNDDSMVGVGPAPGTPLYKEFTADGEAGHTAREKHKAESIAKALR